MDKPLLTGSYKGFEIAVPHGTDAASPAALGERNICGWHPLFRVENPHVNRETFWATAKLPGYKRYVDDAERLEREFHVFPLFAYIRNNIVISLHCKPRRIAPHYLVGCVIVERRNAKTEKHAESLARGMLRKRNLDLKDARASYLRALGPHVLRDN